jgi:adenylate kinase
VNIVLFGPPGAGKGTQANNLVKHFNLHKISTGDLLRDEIKKNTSLSKKITKNINKGELAPDDVINTLIVRILSDKNYYNRLIFDGYPRNIDQALSLDKLLKEYNQKLSLVINLDVSKDLIIKRILGRVICNNCGLIFNKYFKNEANQDHQCDPKFLETRADDNKDTVVHRFETYLDKTLPILNYYKKQNLMHSINGDDDITHIFEEIRTIISSLET